MSKAVLFARNTIWTSIDKILYLLKSTMISGVKAVVNWLILPWCGPSFSDIPAVLAELYLCLINTKSRQHRTQLPKITLCFQNNNGQSQETYWAWHIWLSYGIISAPSRVRIPTDCARIVHSSGSGVKWVLGLWRASGSWSLQFQHLLRHPTQAQRVCHSTPRTAQRRGETPWEQVLNPTPQSFKYHPRKVQTYL